MLVRDDDIAHAWLRKVYTRLLSSARTSCSPLVWAGLPLGYHSTAEGTRRGAKGAIDNRHTPPFAEGGWTGGQSISLFVSAEGRLTRLCHGALHGQVDSSRWVLRSKHVARHRRGGSTRGRAGDKQDYHGVRQSRRDRSRPRSLPSVWPPRRVWLAWGLGRGRRAGVHSISSGMYGCRYSSFPNTTLLDLLCRILGFRSDAQVRCDEGMATTTRSSGEPAKDPMSWAHETPLAGICGNAVKNRLRH
ncbi:hypothetical protein QBC47DRAFT_65341 [Echria macrotheca]|uniref:Uncharacterized protein n=1 Tax=Echria macrotheca TaxID=438768 RepID=A0AAJ0B5J5_9PEZI|nr:hypothetical protein QBC47DRAFT_65341 [Echria macrotheca]